MRSLEQRARLFGARTAKQAKMCCNYPQHHTTDFQIGDQSATWLQTWQPHLADGLNDPLARKYHIAVPPMASKVVRRVRSDEVRFLSKRLKVEQTLPLAGALIDLLQGNDVGVDLPDNFRDT